MSTQPQFCHLHLHTDFSLLDGAIQHGPLAKHVAELGMPAVAITDHGNLFGAISFYNSMKAQQVKPIIGMEAYIARESRHKKTAADAPGVGHDGERGINHLILLATNFTGYQNLVKLSSLAYTEGYYYKPRIDRDLLSQHHEGIIALSACLSGVPQSFLMAGKFDEAARAALEFQDIMGKGNYFLEIQDHQIEAQLRINDALIELSHKVEIPLVVTNDCHYLTAQDHEAHDALICLQTGRTVKDRRGMHYSPFHYVRSATEMWQLFGNSIPDALHRTLEIAERCNLELPKGKNYLPIYPVPPGHTVDTYFEVVVRQGFEERCHLLRDLSAKGRLKYSLERYHQRLDHEIQMIQKMGFPGYFLIVWDFIRYAKQQGIPVGPGRGSAAGSLVAYSLAITDVDPLEYDLMFERFLNPDRVSMPDIDIDFCVRGRAAVIKYVSDFYGHENVSQIITFGTMASRAAIKDIGRVLEMPYPEVEKIAKMIPPPVRGRNVSIDEALKQVPELKKAYETEEQVNKLINLARRLEGCARHASLHAAGVVISPQPLHELVPVYRSPKDEIATQYEMNDLEKTGMLKMDFLGLTTLTIIADCLRLIRNEYGTLDLDQISLIDTDALKLFADGHTDAIFQFESDGMKDLCRRMKPDGLEDLAALNALYRPGPIDSGMVDDYIERRHGRKQVRYDIGELKQVLGNTYGVPVYQEQIMAIFQVLADYTLGEADLVRRAMGKKKREELDAHKERFFERAGAKNYDKAKLEKLWSSLEGFADYAFNRSHSVAYGLLAYQTAYLKAHYPAHFWAAVLSNELDNSEKVARYIEKTRQMDIEILPPDINVSFDTFTPQGKTIRFGLAAIKGIGQTAVAAMVAARNSGGLFTSLYDFTARVEARAVNRRVLESLIKAGAFDSLRQQIPVASWRARLFAAIDKAIELAASAQNDRHKNQDSFFDIFETAADAPVERELPAAPPWTDQEVLKAEKETLGFFITGHPLERYQPVLAEFGIASIDQLPAMASGTPVKVAGMITSINLRNTKKGDRFALCQLEDQQTAVKIVVWPDTYSRVGSQLKPDEPLVVLGRLEVEDEGAFSIIADRVELLDGIRERNARQLELRINVANMNLAKVEQLKQLLDQHRGDCAVIFDLELPQKVVARVMPNHHVRIKPSPELIAEIKKLCQAEVKLQVGELVSVSSKQPVRFRAKSPN